MAEPSSGCLVCGAELDYATTAQTRTCVHCGAARETNAVCRGGHFVCDVCHTGNAGDVIQDFCQRSEARDALAIAAALMEHPRIKLHGPEHHYLVPAVLLAAVANATGKSADKASWLAEARRRAAPISGGFCGIQGACGAAIGTGIFISIVTGATPLSVEAWAMANRMTADTLHTLSFVGGPRCCKRNVMLSVLTAVHFARNRLHLPIHTAGEVCTHSDYNRECLHARCPFYRGEDQPPNRAIPTIPVALPRAGS